MNKNPGIVIEGSGKSFKYLPHTIVMKRELSQKVKFPIYWSVFVPVLTYGNEGQVMTEKKRLQIQAAEIDFLRRVASVSLRDKVIRSVIHEGLRIDLPLLCIER